jgi:hypothetical protein
MIDDVIFILSIHIIALFGIDYYHLHSFAGEAILAVLNALAIIFYYHRDNP